MGMATYATTNLKILNLVSNIKSPLYQLNLSIVTHYFIPVFSKQIVCNAKGPYTNWICNAKDLKNVCEE